MPEETKTHDLIVLYGSQTGQAEAIAEEIYGEINQRFQVDAELFAMKEFSKFSLADEKLVIVVVSSTGDGDPPETAHKFYRQISKKDLPADYLKNLEFALLGLGDSNYSTFQGAPTRLEKQLLALGAQRVLVTGAADDQVGLELIVEPWCEKLYDFLAKRFKCTQGNEILLPVPAPPAHDSPPELANMEPEQPAPTASGDAEDLVPHLGIKAVPFPAEGVSLVRGNDTLRNEPNLRVPVLAQAFVASGVSHVKFDESTIQWQNGDPFPGQHSKLIEARVVGISEISLQNEVPKPKRQIDVLLPGDSSLLSSLDAGDSLYFVFPNPENEVSFILSRLGLSAIADNVLSLQIDGSTQKRDAKLPAYVPTSASLRHVLTWCLDIRRSPSRPLLRVLAEHAKDPGEQRRLQELCSAQGVQEFTAYVRQAAISLVDFLIAFPSVQPPIDRLIELLPRLLPRPYTLASDVRRSRNRLRFVYSLQNFTAGNGIQYDHFGVCSAWLKHLQLGTTVRIIHKEPSKFRLPPISKPDLDIAAIPLILIGPGTGVAPFVAFYEKILAIKIEKGGELPPGVRRYLFYGSVDLDREFILREEIESLNREGVITDLVLCESRPEQPRPTPYPRYVQEAIKARASEIVNLMLDNENTLVYACGDASGMSKDLWQCFSELVQAERGVSQPEALAILKRLKDTERYIEDVWA